MQKFRNKSVEKQEYRNPGGHNYKRTVTREYKNTGIRNTLIQRYKSTGYRKQKPRITRTLEYRNTGAPRYAEIRAYRPTGMKTNR
jgi:hypothetical protein